MSATLKLLLLGLAVAGFGFVAIVSFLLAKVHRSLNSWKKARKV